jgi:hypothetical protein
MKVFFLKYKINYLIKINLSRLISRSTFNVSYTLVKNKYTFNTFLFINSKANTFLLINNIFID